MTDREIKLAVIYKVLKPKAEYFKRLATEQEVDQPRALVESALKEFASSIIVDRGFNQATQADAAEICSSVIARLIGELFPMTCR